MSKSTSLSQSMSTSQSRSQSFTESPEPSPSTSDSVTPSPTLSGTASISRTFSRDLSTTESVSATQTSTDSNMPSSSRTVSTTLSSSDSWSPTLSKELTSSFSASPSPSQESSKTMDTITLSLTKTTSMSNSMDLASMSDTISEFPSDSESVSTSESPTPTVSPSPSVTLSPSRTATLTFTDTYTLTAEASSSKSIKTPTMSRTSTVSFTYSLSGSHDVTASRPSVSLSRTVTPTRTMLITVTVSRSLGSRTPSPSKSGPSKSASPSNSEEQSSSRSSSYSLSDTKDISLSFSSSVSISPRSMTTEVSLTPTDSLTTSSSPSRSQSDEVSPTLDTITPSDSLTDSPTVSSSDSGSLTASNEPSSSETGSSTASESRTPPVYRTPSASVTDFPTVSRTSSPSYSLSASQSSEVSSSLHSGSTSDSSSQSPTVSTSKSLSKSASPSSTVSPSVTDSEALSRTADSTSWSSTTSASQSNSGDMPSSSKSITQSSSVTLTPSRSIPTGSPTVPSLTIPEVTETRNRKVSKTPSKLSNTKSATVSQGVSVSASKSSDPTQSVKTVSPSRGTPSWETSLSRSTTPDDTVSRSPTDSATPEATSSPSPTPSPTPTNSVTPTKSPSPSIEASASRVSATPSISNTKDQTESRSQSLTLSSSTTFATVSSEPTRSASPTATMSPTYSMSPVPSLSTTPTNTLSPTPSFSNDPVSASKSPSLTLSLSWQASATRSRRSPSKTSSSSITTTQSVTSSVTLSSSVTSSFSGSVSRTLGSVTEEGSASRSLTVSSSLSDSTTTSRTPSKDGRSESRSMTPSDTPSASSSEEESKSRTVTASSSSSSSASISKSPSGSSTSTITPPPTPTPTSSSSITQPPSVSDSMTASNTPTSTFSGSREDSVTKSTTPSDSLSLSSLSLSAELASPTHSPSPSSEPSLSKSLTASPSASASLSPGPSLSPSDTWSSSVTDSSSVTVTVSPSMQPSPTDASGTPSSTTTLSATESLSSTVTVSPSISKLSLTADDSLSHSSTSSPSLTATPSPTASDTPELSRSRSASNTDSPTPTLTSSFTGVASLTESLTATGDSSSKDLSLSESLTSSSSATDSGSPTLAPSPSDTPTPTPTTSVSEEDSVSKSITSSASQSWKSPTSEPTATLTLAPTFSQTYTSTVTPSASATLSLTSTQEPSLSATHRTRTPTDSPTPTGTNSVTDTQQVSGSLTETPTLTYTVTPSSSFTASDSVTRTGTEEVSLSESVSASPTLTMTPSQEAKSRSETETISPSFSRTASISLSAEVSMSATPNLTFTRSTSPSFEPSLSKSDRSKSKSSTATPDLSESVTPSNTVTLTPEPSASLLTESMSMSNSTSGSDSWSASLPLRFNQSASETAPQSKSVSISNVPSLSRSPSVTSTVSPSLSMTPSKEQSLTDSGTPTPSYSDTLSTTSSEEVSSSRSRSVTHTRGTASATPTETMTLSLSFSSEPSSSKSLTVSSSTTSTTSPSESQSVSSDPSLSDTHSRSKTSSATQTLTPTPSGTSTWSLSESISRSPTREQSATNSMSFEPSISTTPSKELSATNSVTPSDTASRSPTSELSATASSTPSPSTSDTFSFSKSFTEDLSLSHTQSEDASESKSPTLTGTQSPTDSATVSDSASLTTSEEVSASRSDTPSSTSSMSTSSSIEPSLSETLSFSFEQSESKSLTPSWTKSSSASTSASSTATITPPPTPTPTSSATVEMTETLTTTESTDQTQSGSITPGTQSITETAMPTLTPTDTSTPTEESSASRSSSQTPSSSASETTSMSASPEVTETATRIRTPTPSSSASQEFTGSKTSSTTDSASQTSSEELTASPSPTPTITASSEPSSTPTDSLSVSKASLAASASRTQSPSRSISVVRTPTETEPTRTLRVTPSPTIAHSGSGFSTVTPRATRTRSLIQSSTNTLVASVSPSMGFPSSSVTRSQDPSATLSMSVPPMSVTASSSLIGSSTKTVSQTASISLSKELSASVRSTSVTDSPSSSPSPTISTTPTSTQSVTLSTTLSPSFSYDIPTVTMSLMLSRTLSKPSATPTASQSDSDLKSQSHSMTISVSLEATRSSSTTLSDSNSPMTATSEASASKSATASVSFSRSASPTLSGEQPSASRSGSWTLSQSFSMSRWSLTRDKSITFSASATPQRSATVVTSSGSASSSVTPSPESSATISLIQTWSATVSLSTSDSTSASSTGSVSSEPTSSLTLPLSNSSTAGASASESQLVTPTRTPPPTPTPSASGSLSLSATDSNAPSDTKSASQSLTADLPTTSKSQSLSMSQTLSSSDSVTKDGTASVVSATASSSSSMSVSDEHPSNSKTTTREFTETTSPSRTLIVTLTRPTSTNTQEPSSTKTVSSSTSTTLSPSQEVSTSKSSTISRSTSASDTTTSTLTQEPSASRTSSLSESPSFSATFSDSHDGPSPTVTESPTRTSTLSMPSTATSVVSSSLSLSSSLEETTSWSPSASAGCPSSSKSTSMSGLSMTKESSASVSASGSSTLSGSPSDDRVSRSSSLSSSATVTKPTQKLSVTVPSVSPSISVPHMTITRYKRNSKSHSVSLSALFFTKDASSTRSRSYEMTRSMSVTRGSSSPSSTTTLRLTESPHMTLSGATRTKPSESATPSPSSSPDDTTSLSPSLTPTLLYSYSRSLEGPSASRSATEELTRSSTPSTTVSLRLTLSPSASVSPSIEPSPSHPTHSPTPVPTTSFSPTESAAFGSASRSASMTVTLSENGRSLSRSGSGSMSITRSPISASRSQTDDASVTSTETATLTPSTTSSISGSRSTTKDDASASTTQSPSMTTSLSPENSVSPSSTWTPSLTVSPSMSYDGLSATETVSSTDSLAATPTASASAEPSASWTPSRTVVLMPTPTLTATLTDDRSQSSSASMTFEHSRSATVSSSVSLSTTASQSSEQSLTIDSLSLSASRSSSASLSSIPSSSASPSGSPQSLTQELSSSLSRWRHTRTPSASVSDDLSATHPSFSHSGSMSLSPSLTKSANTISQMVTATVPSISTIGTATKTGTFFVPETPSATASATATWILTATTTLTRTLTAEEVSYSHSASRKKTVTRSSDLASGSATSPNSISLSMRLTVSYSASISKKSMSAAQTASPTTSASKDLSHSVTTTITPPPTPSPTPVDSLNATHTIFSTSSTAAVFRHMNAVTFSASLTNLASDSHTKSSSAVRSLSIASATVSLSALKATGSKTLTPSPSSSLDPTKTLSLKNTRTITPVSTPTLSGSLSLSNDMATISWTESNTYTAGTASLSDKHTATIVSDTITNTVSPSPTMTLSEGEVSSTKTTTLTDSFPSPSVQVMSLGSAYFSVCRGVHCNPPASLSLLPQRVSVFVNKSFATSKSAAVVGSLPVYVVSAGDALTIDIVGSSNDAGSDRVVLLNVATSTTSPLYVGQPALASMALPAALSFIEQQLCSNQLEPYYNNTVVTDSQRSTAASYTQVFPFDAVELFPSPHVAARWSSAVTSNGSAIDVAKLGVSGDRFVVCYRSFRFGTWHALRSDLNGTFLTIRPDVVQSSRQILSSPQVVGSQVALTFLQRGVTRSLLECFNTAGRMPLRLGSPNASACWTSFPVASSVPPFELLLDTAVDVVSTDSAPTVPPILKVCRDPTNSSGTLIASSIASFELISDPRAQAAPLTSTSSSSESQSLYVQWNVTFSVTASAWFALCVVDNYLQQILSSNTTTVVAAVPPAAATLEGLNPAVLQATTTSPVWSVGTGALGDITAVPTFQRVGLLFPLLPNTSTAAATVVSLTATTAFEQSLLNRSAALDEQLVARDSNVTFSIEQSVGLSLGDTWFFTNASAATSTATVNSTSLSSTPCLRSVVANPIEPSLQVWYASSVTAPPRLVNQSSSIRVVFDQFPTSGRQWSLCVLPSIVSATTSAVTKQIWTLAGAGNGISMVWQTEAAWSNTSALLTSLTSTAVQQLGKRRTTTTSSNATATWMIAPIAPTTVFGPSRTLSAPTNTSTSSNASTAIWFAIGTNITLCMSGGRNVDHTKDVAYVVVADDASAASGVGGVGSVPTTSSCATSTQGLLLKPSPVELARISNCTGGGSDASEQFRSFYFDSSALLGSPSLATASTIEPQLAFSFNATNTLPSHSTLLNLQVCFYSPTSHAANATVTSSVSLVSSSSPVTLSRGLIDWAMDAVFTSRYFSTGFGITPATTNNINNSSRRTWVEGTSSTVDGNYVWTVPRLSNLQWLSSSIASDFFLRLAPRTGLIDLCSSGAACSANQAAIGELILLASEDVCGNADTGDAFLTIPAAAINRTHISFPTSSMTAGYGVLCWNISSSNISALSSSSSTPSRFLASPWATFVPFSLGGFTGSINNKLWPGAGSNLPRSKTVALNQFDFNTSSNIALVLPPFASLQQQQLATLEQLYSVDRLVPCDNVTLQEVDDSYGAMHFNVTVVNGTAVELQRNSTSPVFSDLHLCIVPGLVVFDASSLSHKSAPLRPWSSVAFLPAVETSVVAPSLFTTTRGSLNISVTSFVGYEWMVANGSIANVDTITIAACIEQPLSDSQSISNSDQRASLNTSSYTIARSTPSAGVFEGTWVVTFHTQPTSDGAVSFCLSTSDSRMASTTTSAALPAVVLQQDRLFFIAKVTVDPLLLSATPTSALCHVATNFTVQGAGSLGAAGLVFFKLTSPSASALFASSLTTASSMCSASILGNTKVIATNTSVGSTAATSGSSATPPTRTFLLSAAAAMTSRGFYGLCYIGPSGDVYSFQTPVVVRVNSFVAQMSLAASALITYGATYGVATTSTTSATDGATVTTTVKVAKVYSGVQTPFVLNGGGLNASLDTLYIVPQGRTCSTANIIDVSGFGVLTTASAQFNSFSPFGGQVYQATVAPSSDAYLYAACLQQTNCPSPVPQQLTTVTVTTRIPFPVLFDAVAVQSSLFVDVTTTSRRGAYAISGPILLNATSVKFSFALNQQASTILLMSIAPTLSLSAGASFVVNNTINSSGGLFAFGSPVVGPIPTVTSNVSIIADVSYPTGVIQRLVVTMSTAQDATMRRLMSSTWNTAELCSHIPQSFNALTQTLPAWRHVLTSAGDAVGLPISSGPSDFITVDTTTLVAASTDYAWQLATATILARNYLYYNCSASMMAATSNSPDYLLTVIQDLVSRFPALVTDPVTVFSVVSEILVDKITSLIAASSVSASGSGANSTQVVTQFNTAVAAAAGIISSTKATLTTQFATLNSTSAKNELVVAHETIVTSIIDLIVATPSLALTSGATVDAASTTVLGLQVVGRLAQIASSLCSASDAAKLLPLSSSLGPRGSLTVTTRETDTAKSLSSDGTAIYMTLPPVSDITVTSNNNSAATFNVTADNTTSNATQCVAMFPVSLSTLIGRDTSPTSTTTTSSTTQRRTWETLATSSTPSTSLIPSLNMPLISFMLIGGGVASAPSLTSTSAYVDIQYQVSSTALATAWAQTIGTRAQGGVGSPHAVNLTLSAYRFLVNSSSMSTGDLGGFWVPDPVTTNITTAFSSMTGALGYRVFYNNLTPSAVYNSLTSASTDSQGMVVVGGHYELTAHFQQRLDTDLSIAAVFAAFGGIAILCWVVLVSIGFHRCCSCLLGVRHDSRQQPLRRDDETRNDLRPLPPTAQQQPSPLQQHDDDCRSPRSFVKSDNGSLQSQRDGTAKLPKIPDSDEITSSWEPNSNDNASLTTTLPSPTTSSRNVRRIAASHIDGDHRFHQVPPQRRKRSDYRNEATNQVPPLPARTLPPTAAAAAGMQPHPLDRFALDAQWEESTNGSFAPASEGGSSGAFARSAGPESSVATHDDDFLSLSVGGGGPVTTVAGLPLSLFLHRASAVVDLGSVASTPSGFEDPDRTPSSPLPNFNSIPEFHQHADNNLSHDLEVEAIYHAEVNLVDELSVSGSSFRSVTPIHDADGRMIVAEDGSPFVLVGSGAISVVPKRDHSLETAADENAGRHTKLATKQHRLLAAQRTRAAAHDARKALRAEAKQAKASEQAAKDTLEGTRLCETLQRDRSLMKVRTQTSLRWRITYLLLRLHWVAVAAACLAKTLCVSDTASLLGQHDAALNSDEVIPLNVTVRRRSLRERCVVVLSVLQRCMILAYSVLVVMLYSGTYQHAPEMVLLYGLMAAAIANPVATVLAQLLLRTTIHSYRHHATARRQADASDEPHSSSASETLIAEEEETQRKRFPFSRLLSSMFASVVSVLLVLQPAQFSDWILHGGVYFSAAPSSASTIESTSMPLWEYPPVLALILLVPGYLATVFLTSFVSACVDFFTTTVEPISAQDKDIVNTTSATSSHAVVVVMERRSKRTYLAGALAVVLHVAAASAATYFALQQSYYSESIPLAWRHSSRHYTWHQSLLVAIVLDIVVVDPFFLLASFTADVLMLRAFFGCIERVMVAFYRLRLKFRRAVAPKPQTIRLQEPFAEEIIFGASHEPQQSTEVWIDQVDDNTNRNRRKALDRYMDHESATRKPQLHAKEKARIEELRRTRRAIFGVNEVIDDSEGEDGDDGDNLFVFFDDEVAPRRASSTSRGILGNGRPPTHHAPSRRSRHNSNHNSRFAFDFNSDEDSQEDNRENSPFGFDDAYKPPTHYDVSGGGSGAAVRGNNPFGEDEGVNDTDDESDVDDRRFDAASMRSSEGGLFEPAFRMNSPHPMPAVAQDPGANDATVDPEACAEGAEKFVERLSMQLGSHDSDTRSVNDANDRWLLAVAEGVDTTTLPLSPRQQQHHAPSGSSSGSSVDIVFEEEDATEISSPHEHHPPQHEVHEVASHLNASGSSSTPDEPLPDAPESLLHSPSSSDRDGAKLPLRPRDANESDPFDLYVPPAPGPSSSSERPMYRPPVTRPRTAPPLLPPPTRLPPRAQRRQVARQQEVSREQLSRPTALLVSSDPFALTPSDLLHRRERSDSASTITAASLSMAPKHLGVLHSTVLDAPLDGVDLFNHDTVATLTTTDVVVAGTTTTPAAGAPLLLVRDVSPVPSELYNDLAQFALESPTSLSHGIETTTSTVRPVGIAASTTPHEEDDDVQEIPADDASLTHVLAPLVLEHRATAPTLAEEAENSEFDELLTTARDDMDSSSSSSSAADSAATIMIDAAAVNDAAENQQRSVVVNHRELSRIAMEQLSDDDFAEIADSGAPLRTDQQSEGGTDDDDNFFESALPGGPTRNAAADFEFDEVE